MSSPCLSPTRHRLAALMFDMDGVLIQSRDVIRQAWIGAARERGVEICEADVHEHIHGRPSSHTLNTLFSHFSEADRRALKQRVDEIEESSYCDLGHGVRDLLEECVAAKVPMALVTSSWPARIYQVLSQHHLTSHFQTIVHREHVLCGKPDPECYVLAAKRMNVAPAACIAFEDSRSGVLAATGSGALCIGIGVGDDAGLSAGGACLIRSDFTGLRVHHLCDLMDRHTS